MDFQYRRLTWEELGANPRRLLRHARAEMPPSTRARRHKDGRTGEVGKNQIIKGRVLQQEDYMVP